MTGRMLGGHMRGAQMALRLFLLNVLWVLHALRGGIVLGVFPATAAVHAVLRRDAMHPDGSERAGLWREFDDHWRANFTSANLIGYPLFGAVALLLAEHQVLTGAGVQGMGAGVAAVLWFAMALLFVVTANVWMLAVHFDGGAWLQLRRSFTLTLARPLVALGSALGVAVVLCVYYVLPGLAPVLGLALPALVSVRVLWHSGVLPGTVAAGKKDLEIAA